MEISRKPLLFADLKAEVADKQILMACTYEGCGSDDSWPTLVYG